MQVILNVFFFQCAFFCDVLPMEIIIKPPSDYSMPQLREILTLITFTITRGGTAGPQRGRLASQPLDHTCLTIMRINNDLRYVSPFHNQQVNGTRRQNARAFSRSGKKNSKKKYMKSPTVGHEPTTTRLRALRSAD